MNAFEMFLILWSHQHLLHQILFKPAEILVSEKVIIFINLVNVIVEKSTI